MTRTTLSGPVWQDCGTLQEKGSNYLLRILPRPILVAEKHYKRRGSAEGIIA